MRFDDWVAEARRSLEAWTPEPATPPIGSMARTGAGDGVGAASQPEDVGAVSGEPAAVAQRQQPSRRRRLQAVAIAAVVLAVVALGAAALRTDDQQVVVGADATTTVPDPNRSGAPPAAEPAFTCASATGASGDTSAQAFDDLPDVTAWRVLEGPGQVVVSGTLARVEGQDLTEVEARAASFLAAIAPSWTCTVTSPLVEVVDPTDRPRPDADGGAIPVSVANRCWVPEAADDPGAVWGIDSTLAASLRRIDGLADWKVIVANPGWRRGDGAVTGSQQQQQQQQQGQGGPGAGPPPEADRLWVEYAIDRTLGSEEGEAEIARVEAEVAAAVEASGDAAGVATECTAH